MIREIGELKPEIASGSYIAETAVITGDVSVMTGASVWYGAVLRGDSGKITISERANIQDNAVVHEETFVGHDVTVGHAAVLHGCRIEPYCLIGMHSTIMDGAVIGEGSVIGAGSLITKGKVIPAGSIVMGSPARVVKEADPSVIEEIKQSARHYIELAVSQLPEIRK